jgi:hypothetical protein
MKIYDSLKSIKKILSKKNYFLIATITALTFFSLNIFLKNFKLIESMISKLSLKEYINLIFSLFIGGIKENALHSTLIMILISILLGITISLMHFKLKSNNSIKKNISKSGTAGAILGATVPVCAPCGLGLLSLIGLGGVLTYLPYQGTELGFLSIGLLSYSILHMGKDLSDCKSCKIEIKKK